eukprot:1931965-Prymnesium_polylepis.1
MISGLYIGGDTRGFRSWTRVISRGLQGRGSLLPMGGVLVLGAIYGSTKLKNWRDVPPEVLGDVEQAEL